MEENKPNLADYNTAELRQVFEKAGQPAYRARQFIEFVYKKGVRDFGGITSYPVTLREKLASDYSLSFPREIIRKKSPSDGAVKFALETSGGLTESVVMPGAKGATLCVSSQLGCAMGCVFCATGKMGLKKSLSPSGILGQVLTAESILKEENKRIRNIVFMGMGEPLRNIGSLSRVLDILLSPFGHGFSPDRITVSTAGLLDEMRKILRLFPGVRPAISLNAANDALRESLMPVNRKYGISDIVDFSSAYNKSTGNKMTFEYVLIDGVNDSRQDSLKLFEICRKARSKLNLIPFNSTDTGDYSSPSENRIEKFMLPFYKSGITATLRRSKGSDIEGACGQLFS